MKTSTAKAKMLNFWSRPYLSNSLDEIEERSIGCYLAFEHGLARIVEA